MLEIAESSGMCFLSGIN